MDLTSPLEAGHPQSAERVSEKGASPGVLYDRFIDDDPEQVASYERALTNAEVAGAIEDQREGQESMKRQ